jgi:D-glycero-alpha-D-manno-heptose 1-phosphate guanylyltransferase
MTATLSSEAIILAGGFGTRLQPVVSKVPKPMAPIGKRPFLEILMDHWMAHGINRFVLSVGYLAEKVVNHFGNSYLGSDIEYVIEKEPLGTGGALKFVLDTVKGLGERLVLLNGDTWLSASLEQLTFASDKLATPLTLILTEVASNDRYGGVSVDSKGRISKFGLPATGGSALINTGCYLMMTAEMQELMKDMPTKFSLENDLLTSLAKRGLLGASVQQTDFIDIGVVTDYKKLCSRFS